MKRRLAGCLLLSIIIASTTLDLRAQGRQAAVPRSKAVEVYAANCQVCHGPGGTGSPLIKDLAFIGRGKWTHGSRPEEVIATITNGVPGTAMLPFKGRLTPSEISALAALVRSFDKSLKPSAAVGKR
jgi:mono/diheme cytochrome c family protein